MHNKQLDFSKSAALLHEASRYVPGGVHSGRRKVTPPVCVRSAKGAYLYDLDGNRLIDYHAAYGPIILGHTYDAVTQAAVASLANGVLYGLGTTEAEAALARRITELVPSVETVLLANTGNEATLNALRVARAVTGRQLIVKMQGSFNGSHDAVLRNILSSRERTGERDPGSAGMLDAAVDTCLVCRFNDRDDITATFHKYGEQIAAVILEPILHNAPTILPTPGYLAHLRATCDEWGTLLIYDEVITGFRHSLGGYQAIAGVYPDLTTMGKALANGFPIAAFGGKRAIMDRFTTNSAGDVFYGGTYNANVPGVAAALATLAVLEAEPVYGHIFALGERMREGLWDVCRRVGVPAFVSGFGSIYCLNFLARDSAFVSYDDVLPNNNLLQVRYREELIRRGVFEMPEKLGRNHISYSHTDADISVTLEASEDALRAVCKKLPSHPH